MSLLKLLREQNYFLFELLLTFRLMAVMVPAIAGGMLIQDKICLLKYHQSAAFCQNIQQTANTTNEQLIKDRILADTVQFGNYRQMIESVPILLWSLFLGPFLDNYSTGVYVILMLNIVGDLCSALTNLSLVYFYTSSPYLLLVPSSTTWFTGGMMAFVTTAGLYITVNTAEEWRGFRFMGLQVIMVFGFALATYIGGALLTNTTNPTLDHPQIRNYYQNYLVNLALDFLCVILIATLYLLGRRGNQECQAIEKCTNQDVVLFKSDSEENNNTHNSFEPMNTFEESESTETTHLIVNHQEEPGDSPPKSLWRTLLNVDNVRQTAYCFFKPRPNNIRLQLFILSAVHMFQLMVTTGVGTLMVQFAQKVYQWSPTTYASYSSVSMIVSMLIMTSLSAVFLKVFRFEDSTMILIAQISNFTADLIRGTFLSPAAYFLSLPFGALYGFGMIFISTKLSKIISKEETGKIFSVTSTVEALVPLVSSLIYSNLFSLSIATYPGLIYHFSCLLMVISIGLLAVEQYCCPVKSLLQTPLP